MSEPLAMLRKRKSGGHYARLMGTLWRHLKAEQAGDAALGMWMRMLSHCADVGQSVLTKRQMATIMAGDKNGPRKLAALLDAKLVDKVGDGYAPHDFYDHNPGIRPDGDSERDLDGEGNVTGTRGEREGNVTRNVTRNVSKPTEQKQDVSPPLSRPKTQEVKTEQSSGGERVHAPSPGDSSGLSVTREQPIADVLGLQLALGQAATALGWEASPEVANSQLAKAAKRVPQLARARGVSRDEAALALCTAALRQARETGRSVGFALCEVDPSQPARPQRGGAPKSLHATAADHADAPPLEEQLAKFGLKVRA